MERGESKKKRSWLVVDYVKANMLTSITIMVVIYLLYTIGRNAIHAIEIRFENSVLRGEARKYQGYITRDSAVIESLRYDSELERYARENYFMQRTNEEIFIIEGKD